MHASRVDRHIKQFVSLAEAPDEGGNYERGKRRNQEQGKVGIQGATSELLLMREVSSTKLMDRPVRARQRRIFAKKPRLLSQTRVSLSTAAKAFPGRIS